MNADFVDVLSPALLILAASWILKLRRDWRNIAENRDMWKTETMRLGIELHRLRDASGCVLYAACSGRLEGTNREDRVFTELSTDEKTIAQDFVRDHMDGDYAMIIWQRDSAGHFHISVNTDTIEPTVTPS